MKPHEQKAPSAGEMFDWLLKHISVLAVAFGEVVAPDRLRLYAEDLCDLEPDRLEQAFHRARRELKWFPKVAELRKLAGADAETTDAAEALAAWGVLVDFADRWVQSDVHGRFSPQQGCRSSQMPQLSQRVVDTVRVTGGWRAYKCMTSTDTPFQQKRFLEAYGLWNGLNTIGPEHFLLPGEPCRALMSHTVDTNDKPERPPHRLSAKPMPAPLTPEDWETRRRKAREQVDEFSQRQAQHSRPPKTCETGPVPKQET